MTELYSSVPESEDREIVLIKVERDGRPVLSAVLKEPLSIRRDQNSKGTTENLKS